MSCCKFKVVNYRLAKKTKHFCKSRSLTREMSTVTQLKQSNKMRNFETFAISEREINRSCTLFNNIFLIQREETGILSVAIDAHNIILFGKMFYASCQRTNNCSPFCLKEACRLASVTYMITLIKSRTQCRCVDEQNMPLNFRSITNQNYVTKLRRLNVSFRTHSQRPGTIEEQDLCPCMSLKYMQLSITTSISH